MTPGSQGRGRAAVRGPAVFRDAGQDRELPGAPSVYMVNERASRAADWWMFCPASRNDQALAEPVAAAGVRRRRERAGIPGEVRHKEKWRLALDMIDEMTGRAAGEASWRRSRPPTAPAPRWTLTLPWR